MDPHQRRARYRATDEQEGEWTDRPVGPTQDEKDDSQHAVDEPPNSCVEPRHACSFAPGKFPRMVESLASGYGLVEGPTVDADGNLYFSDVLGGGVYRRAPGGDITTVVPKRRGVG